MSDGISFGPTDGDKRAELLRRLADAEIAASREARQLQIQERILINQRDTVAQADELCNSLRKEAAALLRHLEGADAPYEAYVADLDRAIAALSPAPSEEAGKGEDAPVIYSASLGEANVETIGEVEIPEGFVKWDSGYCPFDIGTRLEVLTRKNGVWPVTIKPEAPLLWEHEGHDLDIIAYRVLPSEPAAEAKGEEAPEPEAPGIPYDGFAPSELNAEEENLSSMEKEYLWAFCGLIEPKPWGAAMSAIMECLAGHRLIEGESDATPTKLGRAVGEWSFYLKDHPKHTHSGDTITIAASEQHAEESALAQSLPPLLPPEPPPAATPEQLEATGVIDGEAGWWARKLAKEPA